MILDGVVPEPILAGLDPVLRWGVDLGYDRTTPANVPTPFTVLPTFNPITALGDLPGAITEGIDAAANAAALPVAPLQSTSNSPVEREHSRLDPQPDVELKNTTVSENDKAGTGLRPLQALRDSLKFEPGHRPSAIRTNGDGPLKRIVKLLTGQRPEPAAETQAADDQKPEPNEAAA
jgi:hypothetical protein